ncbi:MAG: hypothetical protein J7521_21235 [Caulobacter sp.]|nr:hypothetical protein [Caulobacter sp.]
MSTIRPAGLPAVPQRSASAVATGAGGSRAAAFFQAAVEAAPTRAAVAPATIQLQTQPQPQRQPPPRAFTQPAEPPQKILRPGSLLNILV